jgi:predicted dehydrogenase
MQSEPLRLGVIGLGRRWRRSYLPALLEMPRQFVVTAVCDPSWDRADVEARSLSAEAVAGPAALFERDDLDAVLFLAGSWQRLWPLELAARRGLPTLCRFVGPELFEDAATLQQARQSNTPFLVDLGPRFAPVTARLYELLDEELGPPRCLLCDILSTRPASNGVALGLIDWCRYLFDEQPERVVASPSSGANFSAVVLRWSDGRLAALRRMRCAPGTEGISLHVIAERGNARLRLPNRISWTDGRIKHSQRLGGQDQAGTVLDLFHEMASTRWTMGPGLNEVAELLEIVGISGKTGEVGR